MTEVFFKNIKTRILFDLSKAEKEINIAVAWFTHEDFFNLLIEKLSKGVLVTVVIINDPINNREGGLNWQDFINAGGNLHFSNYPKIMHHKFCIIDNQLIYNGSFNWTYYADKVNRENVVRFENNTGLIENFNAEFAQLVKQHKKYKRIKKYTLDDLLKFQVDKAYSFYIAKELQANSSWLIKRKKFAQANKILEAAISVSSEKDTRRLLPISENICNLNKQITNTEFTNSFVTHQLKIVERKVKLYPTRLAVSTSNNITPKPSKLKSPDNSDILVHAELLKSLKKNSFQGAFGELRINLKWSTYDDLDLHVITPDNKRISFQNKIAVSQNSKGQLDVDANGGGDRRKNPQENIFWEKNPPVGVYRILVDHFKVNGNTEVPFLLSIINSSKSKIIFGKVNHDIFKTMLVAEINFDSEAGITKIIERKIKTEI